MFSLCSDHMPLQSWCMANGNHLSVFCGSVLLLQFQPRKRAVKGPITHVRHGYGQLPIQICMHFCQGCGDPYESIFGLTCSE